MRRGRQTPVADLRGGCRWRSRAAPHRPVCKALGLRVTVEPMPRRYNQELEVYRSRYFLRSLPRLRACASPRKIERALPPKPGIASSPSSGTTDPPWRDPHALLTNGCPITAPCEAMLVPVGAAVREPMVAVFPPLPSLSLMSFMRLSAFKSVYTMTLASIIPVGKRRNRWQRHAECHDSQQEISSHVQVRHARYLLLLFLLRTALAAPFLDGLWDLQRRRCSLPIRDACHDRNPPGVSVPSRGARGGPRIEDGRHLAGGRLIGS